MEDTSEERPQESILRLFPFALGMNEKMLSAWLNRGSLLEQIFMPTIYQRNQTLMMFESE
jgi:hypothetical protein